MAFTLSTTGFDLLKQFEGCRLKAYQDSAGIWTIGYGTIRLNGNPVVEGQRCTQREAEDALREFVEKTARRLEEQVSVPLAQNQIDALICFCYNVGIYAFAKSSLRKAINKNAPVSEDLFVRWNKARDPKTRTLVVVPGLTNRRKAEYTLFTKGKD